MRISFLFYVVLATIITTTVNLPARAQSAGYYWTNPAAQNMTGQAALSQSNLGSAQPMTVEFHQFDPRIRGALNSGAMVPDYSLMWRDELRAQAAADNAALPPYVMPSPQTAPGYTDGAAGVSIPTGAVGALGTSLSQSQSSSAVEEGGTMNVGETLPVLPVHDTGAATSTAATAPTTTTAPGLVQQNF